MAMFYLFKPLNASVSLIQKPVMPVFPSYRNPSRCTNLLLRSKPVQQNYLRFFKNVKSQCGLYELMKLQSLRETHLLSIFLHYKVKKNKKIMKELSLSLSLSLSWDCPLILDLSLNLRVRMPHIYVFLDYFSFGSF